MPTYGLDKATWNKWVKIQYDCHGIKINKKHEKRLDKIYHSRYSIFSSLNDLFKEIYSDKLADLIPSGLSIFDHLPKGNE